MTVKIGMSDIF